MTGGAGPTPRPAACAKVTGRLGAPCGRPLQSQDLASFLAAAMTRLEFHGQDHRWALRTFPVLVQLSPLPGPQEGTPGWSSERKGLCCHPPLAGEHDIGPDGPARRGSGHVGCFGQMLAPGHQGPPCRAPAHLAQLCRDFST